MNTPADTTNFASCAGDDRTSSAPRTPHAAGTEARPGVTIRVEGVFDLDLEQVFPDGVPAGWTTDDVVAAVRTAGSPERLLAQWELGPLDVAVDVHRLGSARATDTRRVWGPAR